MRALKVVETSPFKIRLIVDVTYDLNGENWVEIQSNLLKMFHRAMDEGLLTGEMDAEVLESNVQTVIPHAEDDHALVEEYMQEQIEKRVSSC